MMVRDMKLKSVTPHDFSINPRAPVERSSFPIRQGMTTSFSASRLTPVFLEEVFPGDMWNVSIAHAVRTPPLIAPVMDNWKLTLFAFFCPNRILWDNWEKFLGAQDNPTDSIDYLVPQVESPNGGWSVGSLADWLGLPTEEQTAPGVHISTSAFPFRMYNKIWNDWFKDENLWDDAPEHTDDGPDPAADYSILQRMKRPDYFTGALPFVQKGPPVTIPLGTTAPLQSTGIAIAFDTPAHDRTGSSLTFTSSSNTVTWSNTNPGNGPANFGPAGTPMPSLEVNLSTAASAQVNLMRMAAATQQYLERDARGGTRYVEGIFGHWGVRPPDYRTNRPEYIGGGESKIIFNAIPQTSQTDDTSPQANLAATGSTMGGGGFSYAATEHGHIMILAVATADLRYMQGIRRFHSRRTRFDYPTPEFAHLGEQAILNKEIFSVGSANGGLNEADQDMQPFGYIPRFDECRYFPSMVTNLMRPYVTGNIAFWHSAEQFATLPVLNNDFIQDTAATVLFRNFAAGAETGNQQFICEFLYTGRVARGLPAFATPGLTRF